MKKLLLIIPVMAVILSFNSSCHRNWICQCVVDSNDSVTNTPINGGTFMHAKHSCETSSTARCSLMTESTY